MTILTFKGNYRFLSNFYPCLVYFKGLTYPTAEHAYQAWKTTNPSDHVRIATAETPAQAKRLGRQTKCRKNWEDIKLDVMYQIVKAKFEQNEGLMNNLLKTGEVELREGNVWHDNFWGNCYCSRCETITGQNNLGKILMRIRNEAENTICN
jgi:ribA/ribD-fused uncharacterized protein